MADGLVVAGVTLTPWIAGLCAAIAGRLGVSGNTTARLAARSSRFLVSGKSRAKPATWG